MLIGYNDPCSIIFEIDGKRIEVNGNATGLKGQPNGKLPVGAYGLTQIDADAWKKIKEKYGKMPAFKTGRIFAVETKDAADSESKSRKKLRSGKEPVDVSKRATQPAS